MAKGVRAPLAACLACVAGLVLVALLAYRIGPAQHLDVTLLLRLSAREGAAAWASVLAWLVDPLPLLVLLAVACAVALRRGRPGNAVAAAIVVAGANLTAQALKAFFSAHPRYQPILRWEQISANAFPSGHATAAASIAIAFALVVPRGLRRRALALGGAFALAVGCAVVVLAWHYPSDVLAGYLLAAGWGFAVLAAMRVATPAPAPAPWPPQPSSRPAISTK